MSAPLTPLERVELSELANRSEDELRSDPSLVTRMTDLTNKGSRYEAELAAVRSTTVTGSTGSTRSTSIPAGEIRSMSDAQIRDESLRTLEFEGKRLAPHQLDHVDHLLRGHEMNASAREIGSKLLLTESDAYRSGFMKATTGNGHLTAAEGAALDEYRAANEGTGQYGGYGIPVLIDPSIILTSGAVDAPVLNLSRVVTITTDAWKGVSAAASSWAYQAEAAVVADDTPTLTQPTISVYAARGFIPYSIEVGQDYPGFAEEMSNLMAQGYIDLLAQQTVVGSGTNSPRGIFTAMAATTTNPNHVTVTTKGTIGGVDIRTAWSSLPERFRSRATWLYSPQVDAQVRALGNGLALSDFTQNLTADGTSILTGRPVVTSDYAPSFTNTTGAESVAVVGDFSTGFVIVQRAGMTVELVPQMFDTTSGRPTGQRGWFAWARHGFDVVNPNAFRLLANT